MQKNKMLIIQSFRSVEVPPWIERCLRSVEQWAVAAGHEYLLVGDEAFSLCGEEYLARAKGNLRTITNLCRLELVRKAHADGYDYAAWIDADVFVFAPEAFRLPVVERYAFARETWFHPMNHSRWRAVSAVNNSVFVCRAGEPDLDFLISATRHVACNREIKDNYQVGGDLLKGLRKSLNYEVLDHVGMFSNHIVRALAHGLTDVVAAQARLHGSPIYAANLCASGNYRPEVTEAEVFTAMDALERSRGCLINDQLDGSPSLPIGTETVWRLRRKGIIGLFALLGELISRAADAGYFGKAGQLASSWRRAQSKGH